MAFTDDTRYSWTRCGIAVPKPPKSWCCEKPWICRGSPFSRKPWFASKMAERMPMDTLIASTVFAFVAVSATESVYK
jgi:hypothetical protein